MLDNSVRMAGINQMPETFKSLTEQIIERLQGAQACISLMEMFEDKTSLQNQAARVVRKELLDDAEDLIKELK